DRGLEVEIDVAGLGGLGEFAGVLGEQRLVGGHHRLACVEGGPHECARKVDAADQLDDDVHVVASDEGLRVGGEQFGGNTLVAGGVAHRDPAQLEGSPDAFLQIRCIVTNDAYDLGTDGAVSEHRDTDGAAAGRTGHRCAGHSVTSKLSRSSTVSRRSRTRETPSLTATTAGRGSRLYLLDIE